MSKRKAEIPGGRVESWHVPAFKDKPEGYRARMVVTVDTGIKPTRKAASDEMLKDARRTLEGALDAVDQIMDRRRAA